MTHLHVFALGKLRMQSGDQIATSFPTRHVEELFAYLLLNHQTIHQREKLIDLLWPLEMQGNVRGRFSTVLWRLRSTFDDLGVSADKYLQATRDTVSLNLDSPVKVDFFTFEKQLTKANISPGGEHYEQLLRAAIDAYQGDLYEGIYADWCLVERERLSRLYLWAMGQLMAHLIQKVCFEEAIVLGQRILQRDSLREEVHRAVMHCYWSTRQWEKAARQFEECSHQLQDELQIMPMPETISLYQRIMADRLQRSAAAATLNEQSHHQLLMAMNEFQQAAAKLNNLLSSFHQ